MQVTTTAARPKQLDGPAVYLCIYEAIDEQTCYVYHSDDDDDNEDDAVEETGQLHSSIRSSVVTSLSACLSVMYLFVVM